MQTVFKIWLERFGKNISGCLQDSVDAAIGGVATARDSTDHLNIDNVGAESAVADNVSASMHVSKADGLTTARGSTVQASGEDITICLSMCVCPRAFVYL